MKRPNFKNRRYIEIEDSSVIKHVFYDPKSNTLDVVFSSDKRYRYVGVTPLVFAEFITSESAGKYFNAEIKDRYEFKKVKPR